MCYAPRAPEIQGEARDTLIALLSQVRGAKEAAIAAQDEDSANAALSCESVCLAAIHELGVWIALREDKAHAAWDHLVDAQRAVADAVRAHSWGEVFQDRADHLADVERTLFPPMVFFSIGFTESYSECTLCGEEYGTCSHVVGRAYAGKFCSRRIKSATVEDVSIVDRPANKRCRVYTVAIGDLTRDWLTQRICDGNGVPTSQFGE